MRIRSLALTNIRRFAGQTAWIESIGNGITVLCEPNEFGNFTLADVYFGRGPAILAERKKIKKLTIQNRRLIHQRLAA